VSECLGLVLILISLQFPGRAKRYFFTAFNLTRENFQNMTFLRKGGAAAGSSIAIKFIVGAFNAESDTVFCYIEFAEDQVYANALISRIEEMGGGCVLPETFTNDDNGGRLAVAAVNFIVVTGLKTKLHFTSGTPTDSGMKLICNKLENNNGEAPVQSEPDEKKTGALLECICDTGSNIMSELHERADTTDQHIHHMRSDIGQRLDVQGDQIAEVGEKMEGIACCISNELTIKSREMEALKKVKDRQTFLSRRARGRMGNTTRQNNFLADKLAGVEEKLSAAKKREEEQQATIDRCNKTIERKNATIEKERATINRQNATIDFLLRSGAVLDAVVDALGRQSKGSDLLERERTAFDAPNNNKRTRDIANGGSEEEEDDEPMSA
jgi:hypothetical protein